MIHMKCRVLFFMKNEKKKKKENQNIICRTWHLIRVCTVCLNYRELRVTSSNLNDFNYRNKALTAKLLRQGYRYFKLPKAFSKFYCRHSALLEKYSVSLKTLLQQGISEPEFYGVLVYRFRKFVGKPNFPEQFRKLIINHYKRIGCSLDIMRQTACLFVNPIIVDGYASLFNCTTAVWASDSMTASL